MDKLEKMRLNAYHSSKHYKEWIKSYHDKRIVKRNFQPRQCVLLLNSRLKLFSRKFKSKCFGPFLIKEVKTYGAIKIIDPTSKRSWTINGGQLKVYLGGDLCSLIDKLELLDPQ